TDQRPGRDDHARAARFPARAARRGPLRDLLQPRHAGGGRAVRPDRGHRARRGARDRLARRTARADRTVRPGGCVRAPGRPGRRSRMSLAAIWTVACKELVDLLRDRKTMALSLLLGPVIIPLLILGMGTLAEKKMRTQLESTLELPVVGADRAPNLVAFLETRNIKPLPAPADPDQAVRDQDHEVVLRIDAQFGEQWRGSRPAQVELVYDSSRQDSQIPVGRVRGVLHEYSRTVGVLRGIQRGVSPEAGFAVQVGQRDVATPEARRGMMLMFLPYMLILFSFLGGAAVVIDVTAGERERQSL